MRSAPVVGGAASDTGRGRALWHAAPVVFALTAVLLALAMSPAGASAGGIPPYGIKPKPKPSQYDITTDLATPAGVRAVYRRPTTRSEILHHLALYTPDGQAVQTYRIILTRRVGRTTWVEIDFPARPNGQTGWVRRSSLGPLMVTHTLIVVHTTAESLTVYRHGKQVFTAPVGTGHLSNPTWPTPHGRFWIAEAFPSSDPFYGPWAFGTTDRATDTDFPDDSVVGIHGTNEPSLIPGDPSHGCIRLKDQDILKLKTLVGIGTPIWIEY